MNSKIKHKILFLASWYPSRVHPISGIFIKKHAEAVSKYCDAAVLFVTADDKLKDKNYDLECVEENGVLTVRVYYKKFQTKISFLRKFINLYRYLKANYLGLKIIKEKFGRPDLVHVNIVFPAGIIGLGLKFLKDINYIITEQWTGYLSKDGSYHNRSFFYKLLTRAIVMNAESVATVSNALKEAMLNVGLKNRYYVIPNIIDLDSRCSNREVIEFNKSKKKIVHISLLFDRQKNVSEILKALAKIVSYYNRSDFELHMIGDGIDRKNLEKLAQDLGILNKFVFFHGLKENKEVYEILKGADFLITNSNYETFSIATAEALACGVPVIATKCGGPEDFVTEECGILIEPGNQKQLEEAILYMLDNCHKYDKEKISNYAKSKFSPEVVGEQFYEIYSSILTYWEVGLCGHKVYIDPLWKVIDIGSGHNPNKRANVLLEKYIEETPHRAGEKAKIPSDKLLVIGDATEMTFEDKAFDFAIASHIAEHIEDAEKFLKELQRIAKRGYIETPGPISEFFLNEPYHLWIVKKKGDTLVFRKKKNYKPFSEIFYAFFYLNENRYGHKTIKSNNKILMLARYFLNRIWKYIPYTYTKYEWESEIKYEIYDD